jgi:hypothetical protein
MGIDQWAQVLFGGGVIGTPVLTLVLTGRLIPIWVVNKQVAALEKSNGESITALKGSHKDALDALNLSHQRELTSKDDAHRDALAVRDREAERQAQQTAYEREAKDIERSRSDALAGRVGDLAAEFGSNHRKLVDAVSEAAGRDR